MYLELPAFRSHRSWPAVLFSHSHSPCGGSYRTWYNPNYEEKRQRGGMTMTQNSAYRFTWPNVEAKHGALGLHFKMKSSIGQLDDTMKRVFHSTVQS